MKRVFYYDVARFMAIISITCNHALSRSFEFHNEPLEEFNSIPLAFSVIKSILWIFSRIGVPLFLMISGALLLNRNYEDKGKQKRFLLHNLLGLLITTEIWLFIMFWFKQFTDSSILRDEGFFKAAVSCVKTMLFINQVTMPSMWYMPMILCVYLVIPLMSVALQKIDNRYIMGLSAFVLLSSMIIPNINEMFSALNMEHKFDFALSSDFIFSHYLVYMLVGFFISNNVLSKLKIGYVAAGFGFFFAATAAVQLYFFSVNHVYFVRYADIGIILSAAFLFELIKREAYRLKKFEKTVSFISKAAFGVYFVHICLMNVFNIIISSRTELQYITKFFVLEAASVIISLLIIYFTSKVKFVKKYFYMIKD